jgi:hypothetical protein
MAFLIASIAVLVVPAVVGNPLLTPHTQHLKTRYWNLIRDEGRKLSEFKIPADQWFNQTLDHYNALNQGVWPQRYWVNASFYTGTGPLFLYVEGEGTGSPYDVVLGQHVELAAQHGALIISLEHRCVIIMLGCSIDL